jgi:hypothetical protein
MECMDADMIPGPEKTFLKRLPEGKFKRGIQFLGEKNEFFLKKEEQQQYCQDK